MGTAYDQPHLCCVNLTFSDIYNTKKLNKCTDHLSVEQVSQ